MAFNLDVRSAEEEWPSRKQLSSIQTQRIPRSPFHLALPGLLPLSPR